MRPFHLLVSMLAAVALSACQFPGQDQPTVTKIVDGDTLDVDRDGETVRVRLLNIDTPERGECLYQEATDRLTELAPPGTRVHLEHDEERQDRYGRELAAVFAGDVFVNEQLATEGLARAVTYEPNHAYTSRMESAQARARTTHLGIHAVPTECLLPTDTARRAYELHAEDAQHQAFYRDAANAAPNFTYKDQALEFIDGLD
ncbi:thermonuclease family protein [Corynebacterium godavarianum]|uniref:Thermonuclease family protein n=1 Tax=Corynebacterium godavarianum TaxID=2054421 RepID=A0ABY3E8H4_9CORY|nr:thermonuclease family protein [Corynebacterium godavarianum]MBL7286159.1 thermonuclease family protein [Corynebacterium godavarianum]TSJ76299.1 thermonuclease family protein [Corynebacterium godavarianum]